MQVPVTAGWRGCRAQGEEGRRGIGEEHDKLAVVVILTRNTSSSTANTAVEAVEVGALSYQVDRG